MDIVQVRACCLAKKGTTEDFPFDKDTLVFKVMGKMYLLTSLNGWELGEAAINVKADPSYSEELRAQYTSIRPGYHMSKKHWNTLYMHERELPPKFIKKLIDHSYDMVVKGLPNKLQERLT